MKEEIWWKMHRVLLSEVLSASNSFDTWKDINNIAASNSTILRRLSENPIFWNTVTHGLQTTFIITLGRVFDKDSRSQSIHKLLSEMVSHKEYFSKQSLEIRKRSLVHDGNESWLPDYMNDVWTPSNADLEEIRHGIQPTIEKYKEIYEPIRNKIFAHRDLGDDIQRILGKSLISDIDDIIYKVRDTLEGIWTLYMNGRKPEFGIRKYNNKDLCVETRRLLDCLTSKNQTSSTPVLLGSPRL